MFCYSPIRLTEWNSKSEIPYIPSNKTRSEKGSINHDFADISRVAFNDFGRHHRSCVRQHILIQHSAQCFFFLFYPVTNPLVHTEIIFIKCIEKENLHWLTKGQTKSKRFFQADVSSTKRTNEFYFTTMKPRVDLFLFVLWKKLKTPKRH